MVGDHVFLKVMPKRVVVRFSKRGKLSPRFIEPFEILERVGNVAFRLTLPPSMSVVHEVFHVSMLWRYTPDPARVVDWGEIDVDTNGTFEEGPVCIMDSRDQVLRRKTVRLVRVLWQHRGVEMSTWEHEDTMRATYCSDPRARLYPVGGSEPKPWDALLFLFIFLVIKFSFSKKISRPESPARLEWRIRTGAQFTPTFSFILSKHFIMSFSCESDFSFGQAHNHLQIQCNSVGP